MTYATPDEVSVLLGRDFSTAESAQCQGFLDDAEGMILERIPDLIAKIAAGALGFATVARVERRAVRRVMLNPEGKKTERVDDYSYGRDDTTASGEVYISGEEWSWLITTLSSGDAFSIRPGNAGIREAYIPRVRDNW